MKPIVKFDVETKSSVPIDYGSKAYLNDPYADLKCMSYKVGEVPTKLWVPGMGVPHFFLAPQEYMFAAFNIQFDQRAVNMLGRKYGFGNIRLDQCIDIMAVAARYTFPQKLATLGKVLKVKLQKMRRGTYLVKTVCCPPFKYTQAEFEELCDYCVRDTDSMAEILSLLPADHLSPEEQRIWVETAQMNAVGVPVDVKAVRQINRIVDWYTGDKMKRMPFLTDGEIDTVHQRDKILKWCEGYGVEMENFQVDTVAEAVLDVEERLLDDFEDEAVLRGYGKVLEVLKLRQLLGGAAVKKFKRLQNMTLNGSIHDNLRYFGATTGRTTGGGFQFLNLPRAKVDVPEGSTHDIEVEKVLDKFRDASIIDHDDPLGEAKKLVRPMLKVGDDQTLMVRDWSSIEYVLCMWFCGEQEKVKAFAKGYDPYIGFATKLFNVRYDDVTKDQRQKSKPPILGGQYTLGANGLIGYAEGYGVFMTVDEAQFSTNTYREDHPLVKTTWYELQDTAVAAVENHRRPFSTHNTKFIVEYDRTGRHWLILTLPSKRTLYYCEPFTGLGKYGKVVKHKGINPYNKQWSTRELNISRLIENIIQALGRDILQPAVKRLALAGFSPRATVYDEIICVEPLLDSERRFKEMEKIMCIAPSWAPSLPLFADGYLSKRYMKG